MTAVKKIKAALNTPAKKAKKAPVAAQTKRTAPVKKVGQAKKVQVAKITHAAKAPRAQQVQEVQEVVDAQEVVHAQEVALVPEIAIIKEVGVNTVKKAAASSDSGANVERIMLPARMELASLDEAQQLLQSKYPPAHGTYILDGALLSVIDMAGIQMLISFIRSVTEKGSKVEWDNYSVQVYQLASELGVTSQLGD